MSKVTVVLEAVSRGERAASEELLPLIYDELRQLATAQMAKETPGQTLQPTALVHEAWLRLGKEGGRTWRNRAHFFRAAARAMRRVLVDRARHKLSLKQGSGKYRISLEDLDVAAPTMDDRVLLVDQCLDRLEKEDPESARVVSLKFFAGLTNKEVAAILEVTERSVERRWAYARMYLYKLMQQEI
jgi:RNA polymerase sigma factor (TIGR02999 family)